jgi:hypothetical protein
MSLDPLSDTAPSEPLDLSRLCEDTDAQLAAMLHDTEARVQLAARLPDDEGLTFLFELALREVAILTELQRRRNQPRRAS